MNEADALSHMEQALEQENGLRVKASNVEQYRQLAYRTREAAREKGDTRFDELKFYVSPSGEEVWIVRKPSAETEEASEGSSDTAI